MSVAERWKFYWPIFLFVACSVLPGIILIKTDMAVVKNNLEHVREDVGAVNLSMLKFERKDVAVLEHEKIALEVKILDQKVEQLRAEFRAACEMWEKRLDSVAEKKK